MRSCTALYHALLPLAVLAACNGATVDAEDSGEPAPPPLEAVCTEPVEPTCVDPIISDLSLHDDKVATDREVTDTTDAADFVTAVDATAGGFEVAAENPWVYIKFTENGAQRVDIDDETALESMDWDLAARRFILRLNGGSSGPSCVGAMPFLEKSYDELTEVPEDASFTLDNFYTGDCTLINDASGLEGSPQTALSPWWEYPEAAGGGGCVGTTRVPFLVQLADGHVIKLRVEQYYGDGQVNCNQTGQPGTDSGRIELRWTFVR
jgi:hypothetical protein